MIHTTVRKHIHIIDLRYTTKVQNIQLTEMRERMAIMIKELQTVSANCNNIEALQGSATHLRAAIAIIKAI